jgi:archaellum biogenesis ATPase FlaH
MTSSIITLSTAITYCNTLPPVSKLYLGIPNTPGVTLIVGKAKSGKSIFMENMAYALLDKDTTHFLGREIATVDRIAILSYEEMLINRTQRQMMQISALESDNIKYITDNLYVFDDDHANQVISIAIGILQGLKPDVVFIDSLGKLADDPIEESRYAQKLMNNLRKISEALQCPLILLHHTVKNISMESSDLSSVAGSRVIGQEADSIYSLSVDPPTRIRTLKPVALRYSGDENDEITFIINDSCLLETDSSYSLRSTLTASHQRKVEALKYICSNTDVKTDGILNFLRSKYKIGKSRAYDELKKFNLQQDHTGCYICPDPTDNDEVDMNEVD